MVLYFVTNHLPITTGDKLVEVWLSCTYELMPSAETIGLQRQSASAAIFGLHLYMQIEQHFVTH